MRDLAFRLIDWYLTRKGFYRVASNHRLVQVDRVVWEILPAAKIITQKWGRKEGLSGEAKRHQAYARLIKEFPEAKHQDIALAIELAVRN